MLYKDINLINTEIEIYRSITEEDIRTVAKKYLNPNQRLVLIICQNRKSQITSNNHEKNNIYSIQSILTIVMQGQIIPNHNQHQYLLSKLVSLLILN
jgi:predicted Zn-dependent peptidase